LTKPKSTPALPSREQLLAYIRDNPNSVNRRDIARAFGIRGNDKIALKVLVKDVLRDDGADGDGPKKGRASPTRLPSSLVVEVFDVDTEEGEALAHPVDAEHGSATVRLRSGRGDAPLAVGDRALIRVAGRRGRHFFANVLRRMERGPETLLAVYRSDAAGGGRLEPTDRKIRTEFLVSGADTQGAAPGELVLAEVTSAHRLGMPRAKVVERLGAADAPRAASLIAIFSRDIPTEFPDAALADAKRARPAPLADREDLRAVALVTIDGEDARDFDDAVFAEPDDDPRNPGGFHLIVAIADVAWYVRPNAALDRAAYERGNSVYFPDRVVPMLPERLSNDLCSLRPDEDRPTLAVHMWIDAEGRKRRHRFTRAMIRSAARLTYDQAQASADRRPNGAPEQLRGTVIEPLYAAYRALARARHKRGTLELDLEERKVELDAQGRIQRIVPRARYDSHRLIEEFMILANVCAAESLEELRLPCMYRVHEPPDPAKLENLREVLDGLGYRLARGQVLKPAHFNRILEWAATTPYRYLVNDLVLRSQSMAVYSPDNRGHFGLALTRYAHFTSPIRRYSDLLVHRALITGYKFGDGGLFEAGSVDFHEAGDHISTTERRAAAAERDALNRYVVAWLKDRVGARFTGRVSGVVKFGLFVTLDSLGADGFVPARSLAGGYYRHDPQHHRLVGPGGHSYTLGEPVEVRLVEAQPVTGGLTFEILDGGRREVRRDPRRERDHERAARGHRQRMARGRKHR
jgi:ribonuclease R